MDGTLGIGLHASGGARVSGTRAVFGGNRTVGVHVQDADSQLTLDHVVVRDTQSQQSDGLYGRGLQVQGGAQATVTRAAFEGNRMAGIRAEGEGTELILADLAVTETQAQSSDGNFGRGLNVQSGARATVSRALFLRNTSSGIFGASGPR